MQKEITVYKPISATRHNLQQEVDGDQPYANQRQEPGPGRQEVAGSVKQSADEIVHSAGLILLFVTFLYKAKGLEIGYETPRHPAVEPDALRKVLFATNLPSFMEQ
jgi:hypothetical protein